MPTQLGAATGPCCSSMLLGAVKRLIYPVHMFSTIGILIIEYAPRSVNFHYPVYAGGKFPHASYIGLHRSSCYHM